MTWAKEETAEMVASVYTRETLSASDIVVWVVVGVQAEVEVAMASPTCYERSLHRDELGMVLFRSAHVTT